MEFAILTNRDNGRQTRIGVRRRDGQAYVYERARRAAFQRIGADTDPGANPPIITSVSFAAMDSSGFRTYSLWAGNNRQMKPFVFEKWHAWTNERGVILLSDEDTKQLREFADIDQCVNWLWVYASKPVARALNAHWKAR